jgi:acid phosphatase (class A)
MNSADTPFALSRRHVVAGLLIWCATPAVARPPAPLASLDLAKALSPPPAPGSAADVADLKAVLDWQARRTQADEAKAQADQEASLRRFLLGMGLKPDPTVLAQMDPLFERVSKLTREAVEAPKAKWARPRPFQRSPQVRPCVRKPESGSYPSGHALFARTVADLLTTVAPTARKALIARANDYAEQRVVGGVHYPTDIASGLAAGTLVANALLADPGIKADLMRLAPPIRQILKGVR